MYRASSSQVFHHKVNILADRSRQQSCGREITHRINLVESTSPRIFISTHFQSTGFEGVESSFLFKPREGISALAQRELIMRFLPRFCLLLMSSAAAAGGETCSPTQRHKFDLVIVGGTGAGVAAAIQASRLNLSVALLEESAHIGGMVVEGAGGADLDSQVRCCILSKLQW